MTNDADQWRAFFPMPSVRRNRFSDCETSFEKGNYQPVLVAVCRDRPFKLELHFQSDSDSNQWGRTTHEANPSCTYSGQVECVG